METLKQINSNSNNNLYNINLKYLYNLEISINDIIKNVKNIKIKDNILYNIIDYLQIKNTFHNVNLVEYNNLTVFLSNLIKNIIKLKNNIPIYENSSLSYIKTICDEYIVFHNNIIKNIKKYIEYYNNYILELINMYNSLLKIYNDIYQEYDILLINFNSNSVCRIDPNFPRRKCEFENKLQIITKYKQYLKDEIDNYSLIKLLSQNIDKSFLIKIKNISYS